MKTKSFFYTYIIFFISFFSILPELKGEIIPIINSEIEGILEANYSFQSKGGAYFSYTLSNEDNLLFTINNSAKKAILNINCLYSESTDEEAIKTEFNQNDNNICKSYYNSDRNADLKMYNVIIPFLKDYKSGSNIYLKVYSSDKTSITIFIRKEGSFLTELKSGKYSNSFAHYVFEFNVNDYIENEYLLSSSEANSIFIFGEKDEIIENIDITSALAISEQSLSAHFWDYDEIYIFIGKKEFKEEEENYDTNIYCFKNTEDKTKFYYYKPELYYDFVSFYYQCTDANTKHYLLVNYGNLNDDDKYYFTFHNLIGSKSSLTAAAPLGNIDINNLEYFPVKRFNYLNITDSHLQVLSFQCSENENKININIKYNKMQNSEKEGYSREEVSYDYLHDFNTTNSFTMKYELVPSYEFTLEIFTPENESDINFNVIFEGQQFTIDNKNIFFFNITDETQQNLIIKQEEKITAIISISPSYNKTIDEYYYLKYYENFDKNKGLSHYYYEIIHEFNANYYVDFEVQNLQTKKISLCYYLTNTALIQDSSQNCFLLPAGQAFNITLNKVFKFEEDEINFNKEEPKYHLVVYSKRPIRDYKVLNVYFRTDLPKSKSIDNYYKGQNFIFLNATLEKNKNSYFNIFIESKKEEKYFDLYILSQTPEYKNELKFDIKCIMKYEIAVNFVDKYFTEENNICTLINKLDYNSNVYHILFNGTKTDYNDIFLIKIVSKEKMEVKFVFDENAIIEKFSIINPGIKSFQDQSAYKILELDESSFSSIEKKNILFYDKDINGIELYARNKNDFIQIFKGSFYILDSNELINKYKDYEKILFVYGKNDCGEYCEGVSSYQIKFLEYFSYVSIPEFKDYYRFPIVINKCIVAEPYYIIFDYGKEYKKENISLAKYKFYGILNTNRYIDELAEYDFEKNNLEFHNYNTIKENSLHISVIKFTCTNKLFTYFDYFTKINYSNIDIELKPGSIKHYIIQIDTNFTFTYYSIDHLRIELLSNNNNKWAITTFENKNINKTSLDLKRNFKEINKFYIAAPFQMEVPILIITYANIENLPKAEIKDLYTYEDEFIYAIPKKAINITFKITKHKSSSRLLLEEGNENENEIKICYNAANMVLLEKNEANCFYLKDEYEYVHNVPQDGTHVYLVFYPIEENKKINITKIDPFIEGGEDNDSSDNGDKKEEKKKNKGVPWFVILIIIILVLIILVIVVLLIFKYTKKTVTSEDIEKNIKQQGQIMN